MARTKRASIAAKELLSLLPRKGESGFRWVDGRLVGQSNGKTIMFSAGYCDVLAKVKYERLDGHYIVRDECRRKDGLPKYYRKDLKYLRVNSTLISPNIKKGLSIGMTVDGFDVYVGTRGLADVKTCELMLSNFNELKKALKDSIQAEMKRNRELIRKTGKINAPEKALARKLRRLFF